MSVTNSDIVNLETALNARALAAAPRIVVRLYDDDLAERVQATIDGTVSRSTSYLAAPAFAAAVLDHQVLRTIAVGRHVLLIAELLIEPGSALEGTPMRSAEREGQVRVLALQFQTVPGSPGAPSPPAVTDWAPSDDRVLRAGDRVLVIATRAGLRVLLAETAA